MEIYIALIVLAGIVAMDTTGGPQLLLSEPFVSCAFVGFLLGDPETGLLMGVLFQMLWFGYMPLGAVRIPDSNMAAYISTSSLLLAAGIYGYDAVQTVAAFVPALLFGVVSGFIGSRLRTIVRRSNSRISEAIVSRLESGQDVSIGLWHMAGAGSSFLRGVVMLLVLVPVGIAVCGIIAVIPASAVKGFYLASYIIWGTACASAVIVSILKGHRKSLSLGFSCGILWIIFSVF